MNNVMNTIRCSCGFNFMAYLKSGEIECPNCQVLYDRYHDYEEMHEHRFDVADI